MSDQHKVLWQQAVRAIDSGSISEAMDGGMHGERQRGRKEVRELAESLNLRLYGGDRLWGGLPGGGPAYCLMDDSPHTEDGCNMARHVVPGCWRVSLDQIRAALENVVAFRAYRQKGGARVAGLEARAHNDQRAWILA